MRSVTELVGVYDADAGVVGELSYFVKARFGRAHCSLCEVTHGRVRERADWQACRSELPVPITMYHRNDQPVGLRSVARGAYPIVAAQVDGSYVMLLGPDVIAACAGSPDALVAAAGKAAAALDLVL